MPYCIVCSTSFVGRGDYCTQHNPYLQDYFHNKSYSDKKHRSSTLTTYNRHHRASKPLAIGARDSYDALEPYRAPRIHTSSNELALAGFDDPLPLQVYERRDYGRGNEYGHRGDYGRGNDYGHRGDYGRNDYRRSSSVGHAVERWTTTHSVKQVSYAVDPYGGSSVTATMSVEREPCYTCGDYYMDRSRDRGHGVDVPVRWSEDEVSLRWNKVRVRGDDEVHCRCFDRGYRKKYRTR